MAEIKDDPLGPYREKRSFEKTPEPPPEPPAAAPVAAAADAAATTAWTFCVQRHDATRLHYDLRIEIDGKLESWAVPQGPTLDPNEKRLAVLVEPHPMLYATFEGNIPKGNYGAGSMMLWDLGTYELLEATTAAKQMERGDFKFRLHGHKLKGEFALVRLKNSAKGNEWLLIKKRDAAAQAGWNVDAFAWSVASGRTQEEIEQELPGRTPSHARSAAELTGAVAVESMPARLDSMLASAGGDSFPPHSGDWLFEIKWDGVRAFACTSPAAETRLIGRHGTAMSRQYPELAAALAQCVRAREAVLDGEITMLDEQGRPSFQRLQHRMHANDGAAAAGAGSRAVYFAFDLLYLDGFDLRGSPLVERKRLLRLILDAHPLVKYSDHFDVAPEQLFALAKAQGLEGILAKRAQSRYTGTRSKDWLKYKTSTEQEFVICGYTEGERDYFGALILGAYDGEGALQFCGTVGTGFDRRMMEEIRRRLDAIVTDRCAFGAAPALAQKPHWTAPEVVCRVRYHSWTDERRLRFPVFIGLREDIRAEEALLQPAEGSAAAAASRAPLVSGDKEVTLTIEDRRVTFTNPGKIYYPATASSEAYVKRDLINYYDAVAELLLPYLKDRPLSLRRYPEGIDGESFFQKHADKGFPNWMRVETIVAEDGHERQQIIGNGKAELLVLANMGCIDQNPWMSRVQSLDHPDFVLIDLDPHGCGYAKIVEAAHYVRRKLDVLELASYPKTTGGDGMHLYIPLEPVYSYEQTKAFCEIVARIVASERPDLFTTPRSTTKRDQDKVYFDYLQNGRGKTISAPYVLRAHPGAPVATPLDWREVTPGLTPQQFHIRNAIERFDRVGDLFAGVRTRLQRLEPAMEKLPLLLPKSKA